jgi:hypothetical protein
MTEEQDLKNRYLEMMREEEIFHKLKEEKKYRKWVVSLIIKRWVIFPVVGAISIPFIGPFYLIPVFVYFIFTFNSWLNLIITPQEYENGLRGRYKYLKEKKPEKINPQSTFKKLKDGEQKRKDYIEFYEKFKNDGEFRDNYLNSMKE